MTLDELKEGQQARIFKVKGRGAFRQRLVEMGFVKGQTVETLRFAPMKDPVEFRILHSEVSLRRDEAALIEIQTTPDPTTDAQANENPVIRRAFLFCLYAGLRFCDVKDLTFAQVDFSNRLLLQRPRATVRQVG